LNKQHFVTFYHNPLHYGMALALAWPWSVGLGLECSGLVNITAAT